MASSETVAHARAGYESTLEAEARLETLDIHFIYAFSLLWAGRLDESERHLFEILEEADRVGYATIQARCVAYLAVIGRKHSGKTTLVVKLAAELGARGHRVMTVKHGSHTFNIDPETTDTYRHYHEGNVAKVAMVAPDKFAMIERLEEEPTLERIVERHMSDADVVICEGFTRTTVPKIEIFRRAAHATPLVDAASPGFTHVRAVVTDDPTLRLPVPVLALDDPAWLEDLATLVEHDLMTSP